MSKNQTPTKSPARQYPGWCVWAIAWASNVTSLIPMHPPDVVKVRCMLASKQGQQQGKFLALGVIKGIYKQSGVLGFYDGLSAAIGRSTIYGNIKLAGYELLRDAIERKTNKEATAIQRLSCGIASGSLGSFMACPVEVALVRMQADKRLQPELRRGYKHVFDAVWRIGKEEGVLTYWRGSTPTITRGVVVAVAQVATYDQFKSVLVKNGYMKDGFGLFVVCSILSGLCYAYLSMPVETVKILMQEQKPRADGTLEYRGMIQSMVHEVKKEGVLRLWRGFGAYWARCGTGTIGLFLAQEQYRRLFNWIYAPKV